jgi:hypothetical protein
MRAVPAVMPALRVEHWGREMIEATSNRRGSARHAEPFGTAACRIEGANSYYHVRDISSSGIALDGPPINNGTQVEIEFQWPFIGKARAQAVVRRQLDHEGEFALEYTRMDGVGQLMGKIRSIEQRRLEEPRPIFCGRGKAVQRAVSELREAGVAYEEASTQLGALRLLQDPWNAITSVVLSPTKEWIDFSVFVSEEYPAVRRILLHQAQGVASARLAIEYAEVDLALYEPWTTGALYAALGLHLTGQQCLSCQNRLTSPASPFCAACRMRSTNLDIRDDLGGGD